MYLTRNLLFVGVGISSFAASCLVRFDSGPREALDAGVVDAGVDAGGQDGPGISDAALPPPPATCKKEGLACVPAAPAGWSGPFSLYDGASASAPQCPSGTTNVLAANRDLVPAPPATCGACECASATGFTCDPVQISGNSPACDCPSGSIDQMPANGCKRIDPGGFLCGSFAATGIKVGVSPASGGQCAPVLTRPTATKSAATWNGAAVGCQLSVPSQVDCPTGNVCAAAPAPPFAPKPCVAKSGDFTDCPGFPYSKRLSFNGGTLDTRDCDLCACGPPPKADCTTMATSTDALDCSGGTFVQAPACVATDTLPFVKTMSTPPTNLTCTASGGAPVGTMDPSDPVTVCCAE